jgi:kinetochore protein Mis13/DSN1
LQKEEHAWKTVAEESTSLPTPSPSSTDAVNRLSSTSNISPAALDDPYQASIFAALSGASSAQAERTIVSPEISMLPESSSNSALVSRVNTLMKRLEPVVDVFADGVHQLAQYRGVADRVANRILGAAANRLEERDSEAREKAGMANVGVGDVLGALSGVMAERERMQR